MSQTLNAQVLDYVEVTGEALDAATKLAQAELTRTEKIASIVPGSVDTLIKAKLIHPDEKQAGIEKLSSHEGAIEVIGNLVKHIQKAATEQVKTASVQGPGAPAKPEKQVKVASTESNYVGRRWGQDDRPESDRVFEERLGIA